MNSLRFQLDTERSRYRKMQSDLQKELNIAFEENTKLTTLLDGKVPKSRFSLRVCIMCYLVGMSGQCVLHSDESCNVLLFSVYRSDRQC